MSPIHDLRKLAVYSRALNLASELILITDHIKPFRLAEQIAGSVVSIASNISEGSERTPSEFIRFLDYSRGSAAELSTQLQIAIATNRFDQEVLQKHLNETYEIRSMLYAFQRTLKNKQTAPEMYAKEGSLER